ncbi:MAG: hypothetical protein KGS45_00245 [Planctomycetes bacterium]|nr:hypothetical protein [Planctomycetota bacterium]
MSTGLQDTLRLSKQLLLSGSVGFPDAAMRFLLALNTAEVEAWMHLALVARLMKEDHTAARFARFVLNRDSKHAQAKQMLQATKDAGPSLDARSTPQGRYLLIRAWNAGFWSDVDHVLGCLLLASLTNRTPVIHWGPDSRYGGTPERSAWDNFFEPVSTLTVHDLAAQKLACFPPKWNHENISGPSINRFNGKHSRTSYLSLLNRPEPVVVADFFVPLAGVFFYLRPDHPDFDSHPQTILRRTLIEQVRPLPQHRAAAAEFTGRHFGNGPVLAVHVRGTDKTDEDPTANEWNQRFTMIADQSLKNGLVKSLFLMTDTAAAQDKWRKLFGDALICSPAQVSQGTTALHFTPGLDGAALGREILVDSLIATHADRFVGMASSNVARMISLLKPWAPDTIGLLGEDVLNMPNPMLSDPRIAFAGRNEPE